MVLFGFCNMEVVLALFVIMSISPSCEAKLPFGFNFDLIHRDSHLSPFYNSSMNQSQALINAAMRSIARANTVFNVPTTSYEIKSQARMIQSQGDYLMKFSIGTPPVESFGIIDSGSDLSWVQCLPCKDCYAQNHSFFDPLKSSTYQVVSCDSGTCGLVPTHACGASTVCRYEITYVDGSLTTGELASDTISFGLYANLVRPNTLFGCGHVNTGIFSPGGTGLIGLGQGPLSLITQLGDQISYKFLYCLAPWDSKATSKIKFGSDATVYGYGIVSVPLVNKAHYSFYHLRLRAIYIGKYPVQPYRSTDIIMDSGSTITFLETSLFDSVVTAVIEAYRDDREPINNPPSPYKLCYLDGTMKDLPTISFSFYGANKRWYLNRFNVFMRLNNLLCLMMAPTKGYSVIGSITQGNFKVLYDLRAQKISFAPADCTRE